MLKCCKFVTSDNFLYDNLEVKGEWRFFPFKSHELGQLIISVGGQGMGKEEFDSNFWSHVIVSK